MWQFVSFRKLRKLRVSSVSDRRMENSLQLHQCCQCLNIDPDSAVTCLQNCTKYIAMQWMVCAFAHEFDAPSTQESAKFMPSPCHNLPKLRMLTCNPAQQCSPPKSEHPSHGSSLHRNTSAQEHPAMRGAEHCTSERALSHSAVGFARARNESACRPCSELQSP